MGRKLEVDPARDGSREFLKHLRSQCMKHTTWLTTEVFLHSESESITGASEKKRR